MGNTILRRVREGAYNMKISAPIYLPAPEFYRSRGRESDGWSDPYGAIHVAAAHADCALFQAKPLDRKPLRKTAHSASAGIDPSEIKI